MLNHNKDSLKDVFEAGYRKGLMDAAAVLEESLSDNATDSSTRLSADAKSGRTGKGADSIAVGAAQPYKKTEPTRSDIFSTQFPALGKAVKRARENPLRGSVLLQGAALVQLKQLMDTVDLNKDDDGLIILPFGQNIRLVERGGYLFAAVKKPKSNLTK